METPHFKIGRQGRAWTKEEIPSRYHNLCPEKIELVEGKLFWTDEERLCMIALLLENVGIDKILPLADLDLWQEAINQARQKASGSPEATKPA